MVLGWLLGIPSTETWTNGGLESLEALNQAWTIFATELLGDTQQAEARMRLLMGDTSSAAQPPDPAEASRAEIAGIWAALSPEQRAELMRLFVNGLELPPVSGREGCLVVPALDQLTARSEVEARSYFPPFRPYLWVDWGWGQGVLGGRATLGLKAACDPESGKFVQWKLVKSTVIDAIST